MNKQNVRNRIAVLTGAVVLGLAGLGGAAARAEGKAGAPSEAAQAAQGIEKALQKHGGEVHGCFAKVLADRLTSAGKVEVAVEVGKGGKVKTAKVQKLDKTAGPALAECIEKAAQGWTIEGIEPGAKIILPFAFKAQTHQYVINAADVPEHALGGASSGKSRATGPKRDAPFTVKVLADEQNVKAEGISLTLLSVGPASRVAMHRHPHSAKILYLVKGHARLLGPEGTPPVKMDEGAAAFVPAGYPHVIENMGRQSTAVFLQAFSPPGPERVYRDPKDARGRAEFEVIRDPAAAKASEAQVVFGTASEAKPVELPKNAGTVKSLVAGGGMSLALYELSDGAELQGTGKPAATEIIYVLSGGGNLTVAGETLPVVAESLLYLPPGTPYRFVGAAAEKNEKIVAVKLTTSRAGTASAGPAPRP